jgi:hypothetical protein
LASITDALLVSPMHWQLQLKYQVHEQVLIISMLQLV